MMINEVRDPKPKIPVSFAEYATSQGVTVKTVRNWATHGRIETVKRNGERYVNSATPLKVNSEKDEAFTDLGPSADRSTFGADRLLNYLLQKQKQTNEESEKAKSRWQKSFLATFFVCCAVLICASAGGMYLWQENLVLSGKMDLAVSEVVSLQSQLAISKENVKRLTAELTTAQIENGTLQGSSGSAGENLRSGNR